MNQRLLAYSAGNYVEELSNYLEQPITYDLKERNQQNLKAAPKVSPQTLVVGGRYF